MKMPEYCALKGDITMVGFFLPPKVVISQNGAKQNFRNCGFICGLVS